MSQTELAQHLATNGHPFHQGTITRIERGERPVRLDEAVSFAAALGCPLEELIGSTESTQQRAAIALAEARADSARTHLMNAIRTYEDARFRLEGLTGTRWPDAARVARDRPPAGSSAAADLAAPEYERAAVPIRPSRRRSKAEPVLDAD